MTKRTSQHRLLFTVLLVCLQATPLRANEPTPYLARANQVLDRWVARKDPTTSLLSGEDNQWSIRTTAAQVFPALVLTSWFTNMDLYEGLLLETLHEERRLTTRLSVFPDNYHLGDKRFVRSSRNSDEILINASAYAGGLARITSIIGHCPWTDRLKGIIDALFLRARATTDYAEGALPSNDLRVTGRVLKTLPLLAELYGDEGYLYYARRVGDAYCVGVMPKNGGLPAERWNFDADKAHASSLILDESGVSFIEGLVSLYAVEVRDGSARSDIYRPALSAMFDVLFQHGLKENDRFHRRLQPDGRGGYSIDRKRESPHTVRLLNAAYRYGLLSANPAYSDLASAALQRYRSDPATNTRDLPALMEATHLSLFPLADAASARQAVLAVPAEGQTETDDAKQLIALLAAHWSESVGSRAHPWRPDLALQAKRLEEGIQVRLSVTEPWSGLIYPSHNRPASRLPDGFPDGFNTQPGRSYRIVKDRAVSFWDGEFLATGLRANLREGVTVDIIAAPVQAPPPPDTPQ